jgi:hypothetical protein
LYENHRTILCEAEPASLCNASTAFFQPALPSPAPATFVAALLALWLTRRSLASFTAAMRFRVGLQTQQSGSLYHELAT